MNIYEFLCFKCYRKISLNPLIIQSVHKGSIKDVQIYKWSSFCNECGYFVAKYVENNNIPKYHCNNKNIFKRDI